MIHIDRRVGYIALVLALVAVSDRSLAKDVSKTTGKTPTMPVPPPKVFEPAPTPTLPDPPAPLPIPALGWPHAILTATSADCGREPAANEVLVARGTNFTGTCAVLTPGFYPFAVSLVVGDNAISSIKVGANVRARAFKDQIYSGGWSVYPPGTRSGGLGGYNDKISSMRIEPAARSQICDDVREGEIALFEQPDYAGDCVVLPGDQSYANADAMGIRNDSISSIRNNTPRRMIAYWNRDFSKSARFVEPHHQVHALSGETWTTDGDDDDISSLQMVLVP